MSTATLPGVDLTPSNVLLNLVNSRYVCGIDEVGRGPLAGPIVAVAAVFQIDPASRAACPIPGGVKDSKKYDKKTDEMRKAYRRILRCPALVDFGVGIGTVEEIDRCGIDRANSEAFRRALMDLQYRPDFIIIDGLHGISDWDKSRQLVEPKADGNYWQVASASILAKVIRDDMMADIGREFPVYDWAKNAGYGSQHHRDALVQHGPTPYHRRSFITKILGHRPQPHF